MSRYALIPAVLICSLALLNCASDKSEPDTDTESQSDSASPDTQDSASHTEPDPDRDLDGSPRSEDCDDHDPGQYPEATERCDGRDNDCDGLVDESEACFSCADQLAWFVDAESQVRDLSDELREAWSLKGEDETKTMEWSPTEPGELMLCAGTWSLKIKTELDLVIQGEGTDLTIMDGGGSHRLIKAKDVNLSIADLTLQNGFTEEKGAAIYQEDGSLEIQDTLIQNHSAILGGGGLFLDGVDLSMVDTELQDLNVGWMDTEGVVPCADASVQLEGGGIWIKDGDATIDRSEFTSIYVFGLGCGARGGSISIDNGSLTVTDSSFSSSSYAYQWSPDEGAQGGIIYAQSSELWIEDTAFHGGIVKNFADFQPEAAEVGENCSRGGVIAAYDSEVFIQRASFSGANAISEQPGTIGGVLFADSSRVELHYIEVDDVVIISEWGGLGGGAIASVNSELIIREADFYFIQTNTSSCSEYPGGTPTPEDGGFFIPVGEVYGVTILINGGSIEMESSIIDHSVHWNCRWEYEPALGGGIYATSATEEILLSDMEWNLYDPYYDELYIESEGAYDLSETPDFTWP
jgi:hypothetical protein